jgi:hypothetical protein
MLSHIVRIKCSLHRAAEEAQVWVEVLGDELKYQIVLLDGSTYTFPTTQPSASHKIQTGIRLLEQPRRYAETFL